MAHSAARTAALSLLYVVPFCGAALAEERPDIRRSENFIVSGPSESITRKVLERAEALRGEIAMRWLGAELADGTDVAVIHVYLEPDKDEGLTLLGDKDSGRNHLMWLMASEKQLLGTTLAHEVAHVVLESRFEGAMPAWAHEAIAGTLDDPGRRATRARTLRDFVTRGSWPSLNELLIAERIAPSDVTKYSVAQSLLDFLLTKGTRVKFLEFAADGQSAGWDAAVRKHYGLRNVAALQSEWQTWAGRRAVALH